MLVMHYNFKYNCIFDAYLFSHVQMMKIALNRLIYMFIIAKYIISGIPTRRDILK